MTDLLKRLAQLTRAHVYGLLERRWSGWRAEPSWQADFKTPDDTASEHGFATPPFEASAGNGLPYSEELAEAYRTLDLPLERPWSGSPGNGKRT